MASRSSRRVLAIPVGVALVAFAAGACSEPRADPEPRRAPVLSGSATAETPSSAAPSAAVAADVSPPAGPIGPRCPHDMAMISDASFVVGAATPEARKGGSPTLVSAYCLDRTEVTTEAYAACVTAGRCSAPLRGGSCSYERASALRRPINCVGFVQAEAFCKIAGKRLPTEAEWESAAGAGVRTYPWGDAPPGKGVCWDGAENALGHGNRHDSCDVGTFDGDLSPDGVRDLGGNLTEWTVPMGGVIGQDPNQSAPRRGGTWGTKSGPFLLRTTSRRVGDYDTYKAGIFTGFRCAANLEGAAR